MKTITVPPIWSHTWLCSDIAIVLAGYLISSTLGIYSVEEVDMRHHEKIHNNQCCLHWWQQNSLEFHFVFDEYACECLS